MPLTMKTIYQLKENKSKALIKTSNSQESHKVKKEVRL